MSGYINQRIQIEAHGFDNDYMELTGELYLQIDIVKLLDMIDSWKDDNEALAELLEARTKKKWNGKVRIF